MTPSEKPSRTKSLSSKESAEFSAVYITSKVPYCSNFPKQCQHDCAHQTFLIFPSWMVAFKISYICINGEGGLMKLHI